jgi:pimeloyl-ACP methyl ester carboxylesterase
MRHDLDLGGGDEAMTKTFRSGDVEIAFLDEGEGEPIVLVHGFASTKEVNWVAPGWVSTLTRGGRRVIALDNRGHGQSAKLYDPAAYHSALMAEDVRALLDHLGLPRADVMGYSMGARNTAFLALAHPGRVRSAIFGGLGINLIEGAALPPSIADALEAPSLAAVQDPFGRTFRAFAEQTKSDLRALAACIRGSRQTLTREDVAGIAVPLLIAVGSKDFVAGSARELAAIVPGAQALYIPDRDHMLAVGDKVFKQGVLAFLSERP